MEAHRTDVAIERVRTLLSLDREAEALEACGHSLAVDPDNSTLLSLASIAARRLGRNREAVLLGRRAVVVDPDSDWAHSTLAGALLADGWEVDASSAAYTAVRLGPQDWRNHLRLAECLLAVSGGREAAWRAASRAVELAPHEPEAHHMIAEVAFPGGVSTPAQLDLAERAIREALRLDPGNAAYLNNLARVQLERSGVRGTSAVLAGFSGAAVADPRRVGDLASDNVRLVLCQVIHRQALVAFGGVLVGITLVSKNPSLLGRVGLLAVVLALAAFLVFTWRRYMLGAHQRVVVLHVFRHDRRLVGAAVLLVLAIAVLSAGAFVSSDRVTTVFWLACLGVAGSLFLCPHP